MKYVIYYWSRYGHNKKIADYLSTKFKDKKADVKIFNVKETDPSKVTEADVYVFSAAAEAFNVQKNMRRFMKKLDNMDGKKYGIINTHSMQSKNWLSKMEKLLSKKNMEKIAETDFIIAKEGQSEGKGLTGNWKEKLDDFSKKL